MQLGRVMLVVPLGVHGGVAQAEVGAEVDDPDAALAQLRHERRGGAVRIGDDRRVDLRVAVDVELFERQRHAVKRIQLVEPRADVAASRDRAQLERGVAVQLAGPSARP